MELFTNGNRQAEATIFGQNMELAAAAKLRAAQIAGPLAVEGLNLGTVIVTEGEIAPTVEL